MIKNILLLSLVVLLVSSCSKQYNTAYLSPAFEKARNHDRVLAILPFEVINRYKKMPKGSTIEILKERELQDALVMQRDLYRYCLRAYSDEKYTIFLQNYQETNEILKMKGIHYEDIKKMAKEELAEVLGVDAVISGKVRQSKGRWNSDGFTRFFFGVFARGEKIIATLAIHNRQSEHPIWKYNDGVSIAEEDTVLSLSRKLLRSVSQRIPYQRDMERTR